MTQFELVQQRHQAILDLLNARPGLRSCDIERALSLHPKSICRDLLNMVKSEEISRTGNRYSALKTVASKAKKPEPKFKQSQAETVIHIPRLPGKCVEYNFYGGPARKTDAQKSRPRGCTILEAGL